MSAQRKVSRRAVGDLLDEENIGRVNIGISESNDQGTGQVNEAGFNL